MTIEKLDDLGTAFAVALLRIANGAVHLLVKLLLSIR